MTMDKSLRSGATTGRARGVLTRGERLEKLKDAERWKDGQSPYGLPKVRVYKLAMKKKKKKKEEEGEGTAVTAAPAAGAASGKKAAAAPAKKPAGGAKK